MANDKWCRHYSGVGNGPTCAIGVPYDGVRSTDVRGNYTWPCYDPVVRSCCGKFESFTQEEIAEDDRLTALFLEELNKLNARETEECLTCHAHIERMQQVGRCTYARPCGHRLWQGTIPEVWGKT